VSSRWGTFDFSAGAPSIIGELPEMDRFSLADAEETCRLIAVDFSRETRENCDASPDASDVGR
jgi:hypothetical protein